MVLQRSLDRRLRLEAEFVPDTHARESVLEHRADPLELLELLRIGLGMVAPVRERCFKRLERRFS